MARTFCAAHSRGPRPPGPPPTTTEANGLSSTPALAEYIAEHLYDAVNDLEINGARCRQVDAGRRQLRAVGTATGVSLVRRQRRQRMEERPHLDLGFDGGLEDGVAFARWHLHAGEPNDRFVDPIHRRRKAHTGDRPQGIVVKAGDSLVARQRLV